MFFRVFLDMEKEKDQESFMELMEDFK